MSYKNGKIYKLMMGKNIVYVGSTLKTLKKRKKAHISKSKEKPNRKVYKHINQNGGFNKVKIKLIEKYPCNTKQELFTREDHYINLLKPLTNINKALITPIMKKQYINKWRQKHPNYMPQYLINWKNKHPNYMSDWRCSNKDKMKDYRLKWARKLFKCKCGVTIKQACKYTHLKSAKHKKNLLKKKIK